MPEPLSAALSLCVAGYAALNAYRRNDTALSPDNDVSITRVENLLSLAESSQALFGAKARAISTLNELVKQCSKDNCDGDGAVAIDYFAQLTAKDLIRSLPNDIAMPEFAPEPDGAVSLDWIVSRYRMFSVSVGPSDRLSFAWLDGTDRGHGVAHFDGATVPTRLLTSLRSITDYGSPSVRLA